MRNFLIILLTILTAGCFKEEQPVPRRERGGLQSSSVEMGNSYRNQVYFNIQSNSIIYTIDKFSWDIAFSCNLNDPFIELNSSKSMSALMTDKTQMAEVKDTTGFFAGKKYDYPSGFSDSMALSSIFKEKKTFIIDLGYNESSQPAGLMLLKAAFLNGKYYIEYTNFNGTRYHYDSVSTGNISGRILYNFKTGNAMPEPDLNTWDFLFTQYTHIYYDPFQSYSVTGCMINKERVMACAYNGSKKFNELTVSDTLNCIFSSNKNIIGFDWKYFDLQKNQYYLYENKSYFIRHASGKYYKLHFIDFYNTSGVKGTPVFEYKEL